MGVAMQRGSDLNRMKGVNQHHHDHKQTLDVYQMRPRSRKLDEKKTFMLSSGSLRKDSIRFASSWALANASSTSSESESESSVLASGSASRVEFLGASGAGFCFSRPIYIRNWCKAVRIRNSFHRVYVAYDVPHVLHALCSRWPCATTFEVLAS